MNNSDKMCLEMNFNLITDQLKELKKVTLAKIICSTADEKHIMTMQPKLMTRTQQT